MISNEAWGYNLYEDNKDVQLMYCIDNSNV